MLLCAQPVFSQQKAENYCGTAGITPWFEWYAQNRHVLAQERGLDTAWLYIPVTLQITGNDAGAGHFNLEQGIINLNIMNQQFADARMRFYLMPGDPFRYLNNAYWHDHEWEGGADLINNNRLPNRLNAFVVQDPAGNCGYSWIDAIVLGKGCSGTGNTTWAHEVGHHFSLPHPFFGWEGESWDYTQPAPTQVGGHPVEKTDGSNCYQSGDYFCDTPPDYLNYRWNCNPDKESVTLQHDPNGVEFRSDASLFMGYALDECANRFTAEQITAMRDNIMFDHSDYLQITDPLAEVPDDQPVELIAPIDTAYVQYNNVTFSWNAVPNATLYAIDIALFDNMEPRFIWETVYNTTSLTLTKNIPNNRLLFWRVRPYNEWDLSKQLAPQQVGVFRTKNFSATNDLERVLTVELTPNPVLAGSDAKLQMTADDNMEARLTILDAAGRQCYIDNLRIFPGENLINVPTGFLNAGMYFISLQNEKGTILKRMAVAE
jgi:hypothetical protein